MEAGEVIDAVLSENLCLPRTIGVAPGGEGVLLLTGMCVCSVTHNDSNRPASSSRASSTGSTDDGDHEGGHSDSHECRGMANPAVGVTMTLLFARPVEVV